MPQECNVFTLHEWAFLLSGLCLANRRLYRETGEQGNKEIGPEGAFCIQLISYSADYRPGGDEGSLLWLVPDFGLTGLPKPALTSL